MERKHGGKIVSALVGAAMLVSSFTPLAAFAADGDYILNIGDTKVFDHTNFTTTQTGSANLYYYGCDGTSISSDGQDVESDKPIKVNQTVMTDWKSAFWTEGQNYSTDQNTVVDITFKVSLEDYSQPSPYVGLRLYTTNNYVNCDGIGWRGMQLTASGKDKLHHMRYVLSKGEDGKAVVLYSLDGAAYSTSNGSDVPDEALTWGYDGKGGETAQLRFMPTAIPSAGRTDPEGNQNSFNDGVDPLDTPVNWEFYSFTAYQTDEVPEPPQPTQDPSLSDREYFLNISDQKLFDDKNSTVSQDGSITIGFFGSDGVSRIYSDQPRVVSSAPIKIEQTKASDYKTCFTIPGDTIVSDRNAVIDVKFRVSLEEYPNEYPRIGISLAHSGGQTGYIDQSFGMNWAGAALTESEKDKDHTVRFVISPEGNATNPGCMKIYYSYDGADYNTNEKSNIAADSVETYGGQLRLWIEALLERNAFVDGVDALPTIVNWEIDSIEGYYADDIPKADEGYSGSGSGGDEEELPTAYPVATAVPIPAEFKDSIVRAYPEGRMKAAVISLDDGADWCLDSDLKAIEILKRHNAKATFNLVPGNASQDYKNALTENYAGMEVASHSNTHPQLDQADNATFKRELELSKTAIESAWGSEIGGLAYPYSCAASSDPVRLRMIQDLGYRYARNCIMTNSYDVPESFYDLNPTGWVSIERDWDNGTVQRHMDNFASMDASSEWKMLFLAGHAWQFNATTPEEEEAGTEAREDIWNEFEQFVTYLEENSADIWNPTTIEIVDYVTACRMLTVTANENGASLYNPSEMTVWANVDGVPTEIGAGATVQVSVKPEPEERPFKADEYIVDIDDNITVSDSANSIADGTSLLNSTSGVMSSSTSDEFIVRQEKKQIWTGYLNFVAPQPAAMSIDKPVVIEARYRVTLDDYSVPSPKARLALALTNFNIYANSNASTEIYTPLDTDGYRTVKFIVDPVTAKVYTMSDGKLISTVDAQGLTTGSTFANGIRLYMNVCPADDNMSNDGDGSTALSTSVYWNFDYVKMYELEDSDTLRIVSATYEADGGNAGYSVRIRNDHPTASGSAVMIAALYDGNGRLVKTEIKDASAAPLTKTAVTGSFDVTGLTDYSIKAFLWDSAEGMTPVSECIDAEGV